MKGIKCCTNGDGDKGVNFDVMPCKYWSNTTKMSYLQRRIIVYSIMYYENDESCVSDRFYDNISHQLVKLMQESSEEQCKATTYWYAFKDFDGSTGFDIPSKLNKHDKEYLNLTAKNVHSNWRKETKGKCLI